VKIIIFIVVQLIAVCSMCSIDHLIVAPAEFIPLANQLADFFREHFNIERTVVDQQDIFDQYGETPEGIKDYIKYSFPDSTTWLESSVLLLGSGTNQWELNIDKNRIMVYQDGTTVSDDFFVMLNDDNLPDIPIGRIPAQNIEQLELQVNRIISYIESPVLGSWRNNVLILADDQSIGTEVDFIAHTEHAEITGNMLSKAVLTEKILGIEFEMDDNFNKPEASEIVISELNRGKLIWHYVGHGGYNTLGHEDYFRFSTQATLLENSDHLFLFTAAACDVGCYYDPEFNCIAEGLLFLENGGAITSIAATSPSSGSQNSYLFLNFYNRIVNERSSIGKGLQLAKSDLAAYCSNNRKYNILGDPLLVINPPVAENFISLSSDILHTDDTIHLTCQSGNNIFSGNTELFVYEPEYSYTYEIEQDGNTYHWDYTKNGHSLYRFESGFSNGEFTTAFTVPESVNPGDTGRILAYIYNDEQQTDFVSYFYPLHFTDQSAANDNSDITGKITLLNFPNPFNPSTVFQFTLPGKTVASLEIYNIKGQKVKTFSEAFYSAGKHKLVWDGTDENKRKVSSGLYFYQLRVEGKIQKTEKCLLLK